jgi:glucan phosphorylase
MSIWFAMISTHTLKLKKKYIIKNFKSKLNLILQNKIKADRCYANQDEWVKKSILNAVLSSKFSTDRTIHEYAKDIW